MSDQTQTFGAALDAAPEQELGSSGESFTTVLWRFKWLLILFAAAGVGFGYWSYLQKPVTYRSSSQLMFKSDQPLLMDTATGTLTGGIPSGGLMQSLITSDAIVSRVAENTELKSIPSLAGKSAQQIQSIVRSGIRFKTVTSKQDARDRMIAAINFDGKDPQVCRAAVSAFSSAIDAHFEAERESSVDEIGKLINNAQSKLFPLQASLEEEYKAFRGEVQLEWGVDGKPINPHRERQFMLQSNRIKSEQKIRELMSELRFVKSIQERHTEPTMVLQIIGKLGGRSSSILNNGSYQAELKQSVNDDLALQKLEVERTLVPLQIKREQLELAYGDSHPEVRSIATQVESSIKKLNDLNERLKQRKEQLQAEIDRPDWGEETLKMQAKDAQKSIDAYVGGLAERVRVIQSEMEELDGLIATEKTAADKLKQAEDDDASFQRRIASVQRMLIELEQQLSALNLVDSNGGIIVQPLLATSEPYVTGPDLKQDLIFYGVSGLALGALLAMLIEAGAKTFRSADEIQRELRVPVLTHIPLDEGRVKKGKGVVESEISKLDPKLSVVHRPYSPASEAVRGIRTAVLFDQRQFDSKVFQITSPLPGDGKSTVAANLACSMAQSGKRTLLIDLDLRSPRLSLRFNLEAETGLTNVLNGEMAPSEAIQQTAIEHLDILPCGALPANPAEALTLPELDELFKWARENYDAIIVDTPPLLMVSDPTVVTVYADATMLVVRIRRRSKPNTKEAVAMLRAAGSRLMGAVVNKVDELGGGASYEISASGSYQSTGYGYGDKYRRRYQQEANVQDTYIVKGRGGGEGRPMAEDMGGPRGAERLMHERESAVIGSSLDPDGDKTL